MAQVDQRPRHARQSSRPLRTTTPVSGARNERRGTARLTKKDDVTVKYIKRVLCSQPTATSLLKGHTENSIDSKTLEELLPPLTSSNEVDVQLYAIIAVILSQFVQNWYNRITQDQDFVAEVVQIIAHCTRGLEQRLRQVDLEELVFDEIPALAVAHVDAVKVARDACGGLRPPSDIRSIYYSIRPHVALTPLPDGPTATQEQQDNEIAWSQLLVSRILPLVLPPEDLRNPCLHVLVSEVFSEMIVHRAVCETVSEPWLLWEGVINGIHALQASWTSLRTGSDAHSSPIDGLEHSRRRSTSEETVAQNRLKSKQRRLDIINQAFWSTLQYGVMAWSLLRWLVVGLTQASSLPARTRPLTRKSTTITTTAADGSVDDNDNARMVERPVVCQNIWPCLSRLSSFPDRMPWATGFISLLQWLLLHGPGRVGRTDSALDRFLSSQMRRIVLQPALLPLALQSLREALFPDNALAPARPRPTKEQELAVRRACAATIVDAVPEPVRNLFFASRDRARVCADVEDSLDLFGDVYLNKHFVVGVVELLVVRLFPELGVADLGD